MDSSAWRALLRLIPPNLVENLLLITTNKTEFAVQGIIRDVDDFLVVRGRLTGIAETGGGFFFIPYESIQYLGFQRAVKEPEVRAIFPSEQRISPAPPPAAVPARAPEPGAAVPLQAEPAAPEEAAPAPEVAPAAEPEPGKPKSGERPVGAAKAALLERLRARRAALDPSKQAGAR